MDFKIQAENRAFTPFLSNDRKKWHEPFLFVQAADTQLGMIENYIEKKENPKWDKEILLCKKAIEKINKLEPRPLFMVICGDLVDAWPEGLLRKAQENDFKKVFSNLSPDIPLVCVCGNHDVGNIPTTESIEKYKASFGDDFYSFWCGGCFFVVLNSQLLFDKSHVAEYAEFQLQWLESQLKAATSQNATHIIVFQHIPWFIENVDEENSYFNIPIDIRKALLEKLSSYGVKYIFCGHYHRNACGRAGNMEIVVTSAVGAQLGTDDHGLRLVTVHKENIFHKYYNLNEIPNEVKL